jgi:hypothetical protein
MLDPFTVGSTQMDHHLIEVTGMDVHTRFRNLTTARVMTIVRQQVQSKQRISLGLLLEKSIALEATDLRDKVFALLGLVTLDLCQNIAPDYRTPLADVYLDVMCRLLGSNDPSDGRTALQYAGIGYERSDGLKEQHLPSWVPDWSYDHPARALRLEAGFTVPDDSKELKYVRSRSFDNKRLLGLQGIQLNRTQHLGSICDLLHVSEDPFEYIRRLKTWLLEGVEMVTKGMDLSKWDPQTQQIAEALFWSFLKATYSPSYDVVRAEIEFPTFLKAITDGLAKGFRNLNDDQTQEYLRLSMDLLTPLILLESDSVSLRKVKWLLCHHSLKWAI